MSDFFKSLVEFYVSHGFSGKEAIEKAENQNNILNNLEMEKIKLEQIKESRKGSSGKSIILFHSI